MKYASAFKLVRPKKCNMPGELQKETAVSRSMIKMHPLIIVNCFVGVDDVTIIYFSYNSMGRSSGSAKKVNCFPVVSSMRIGSHVIP